MTIFAGNIRKKERKRDREREGGRDKERKRERERLVPLARTVFKRHMETKDNISRFLPVYAYLALHLPYSVASAAECLYCVPWSFRYLLPRVVARLMRFREINSSLSSSRIPEYCLPHTLDLPSWYLRDYLRRTLHYTNVLGIFCTRVQMYAYAIRQW